MSNDSSKSADKDFQKDSQSGFYPIHRAAKSGNGTTKELKRLLAKGVDVNVTTPWKRTPLFIACLHGESKKVELLLEAGAKINVADHEGDTPFTRSNMWE
ncbi:ankyrin repeat domain-containing protein [Motilimonas cestriensis]|uniref:ankyrin repeat domain-containing protein n=1 Tax=Motilimonas cestriensis TaxID=2742685 RepID=UPI003DA4D62A